MKSNNPHESYKYWSSQEDEKLLLCVENNKKNNKINWDAVERLFPNRTRVQIKAHYTNNLKKTAETYYKLAESEKVMLMYCYLKYGKDYELI